MDSFFDLHEHSLIKTGEELCGDTIKSFRTDDSTIIVHSDGLGSGVKACILSTLTTEIIVTLLKADVPLQEVMRTVIGTLPICKVRHIAYATFTIVRINHADGGFNVINFDNPPILFFRNGRAMTLPVTTERILDNEVRVASGKLEKGDFLGSASDGVMHAGLGHELNFGWGWDNVSKYIEGLFITRGRSAQEIVDAVITETERLYRGKIGDDASFIGMHVRNRNALMVFTGPPLDPAVDASCAEKLLSFRGRRVICGGTTGNIVANYLGAPVETEVASMRRDVPPIGKLPEVDLLTEGIFTMSRTLEHLRESQGEVDRLPVDNNGAVLLARELLLADTIHFMVGQRVNEYYQNPLLPKNISIRCKLVEDIAHVLTEQKKEVRTEYY